MKAHAYRQPDKLGELILLIAESMKDERHFGVTKMHKILFLADVKAYRKTGHSITGQRYMKKENGPMCRGWMPVSEKLQRQGQLTIEERPVGRHTEYRPIAEADADKSAFTDEELGFIQEAIEELRSHSADSVSRWSHEFPGWQVTEMNEDIPMPRMLLKRPRPLTEEELEYGRRVFSSVEQSSDP